MFWCKWRYICLCYLSLMAIFIVYNLKVKPIQTILWKRKLIFESE
nr:MAG TPA: hypothetical protein [Caudoviricetes sp.]